jgi:hypothetical protein
MAHTVAQRTAVKRWHVAAGNVPSLSLAPCCPARRGHTGCLRSKGYRRAITGKELHATRAPRASLGNHGQGGGATLAPCVLLGNHGQGGGAPVRRVHRCATVQHIRNRARRKRRPFGSLPAIPCHAGSDGIRRPRELPCQCAKASGCAPCLAIITGTSPKVYPAYHGLKTRIFPHLHVGPRLCQPTPRLHVAVAALSFALRSICPQINILQGFGDTAQCCQARPI